MIDFDKMKGNNSWMIWRDRNNCFYHAFKNEHAIRITAIWTDGLRKPSMKEKSWCRRNGSFITATCKSRNWTPPTRRKQRCPYCDKPICGIRWNRWPRASWPWASLMKREPGRKTCTARTTCWKTLRRSSASERDAAPCTNTARMGILSGWKGMPQRTICSGSPANTLMTNWGWYIIITDITMF